MNKSDRKWIAVILLAGIGFMSGPTYYAIVDLIAWVKEIM